MIIPTPEVNRLNDEDGNRIVNRTTEDIALWSQFLPQPARTIIGDDGERYDIPAKPGLNLKNCSVRDIKLWINDNTIKKSPAGIRYVYRHLSVRYPMEFTTQKNLIDRKFRKELEIIESESRNEAEWFGDAGWDLSVDGKSLVKGISVSKKNDKYRFVKI